MPLKETSPGVFELTPDHVNEPKNMPSWTLLHPGMTPEHLGYIPTFLDLDDPRPAKEQIDEHYVAGWVEFKGFTLQKDMTLTYEGDPPYHPVAFTTLREELIVLYPHAWTVILQRDGSFEVARLD